MSRNARSNRVTPSQAITFMVAAAIAVCVSFSTSFSQPTTFIKQYDFSSSDKGYCVRQTPDGGYVVVGQGALIMRTDCHGDLLWARWFPGVGGIGLSVVVTDSGNYVVAAWPGFNTIKVSPDGNLIWAKSHLPPDSGSVFCLTSTLDGGFIETGVRGVGPSSHIYILKLNQDGDSVWAKTLGDLGSMGGACVSATADSGCVVVGALGIIGPTFYRMYMARLTSRGDTIWTRFFLPDGESYGSSVQQTRDGDFIATGITYSGAAKGSFECHLIKVTSNGDLVWTRGYPAVGSADVAQTADHGYILGGTTSSLDSIPHVYLVKTDEQGDTLWTRQFRDQDGSRAASVRQTSDSCYILAGTSIRNQPTTDSDILLIKTTASGLVIVKDPSSAPPEFRLFQNYPNPFNPATTIRYTVPGGTYGRTSLRVYDVLGREVATLVNEEKGPGEYTVRWDASNVASGVYMYRLSTGQRYSETKKLVLIR